MRHRDRIKTLSKTKSHRKAMLNNMAASLYNKESIKTTLPKAKVLRSFAEKLITKAKTDTVPNQRYVAKFIKDKKIHKKLFQDIAKRYENRPGGYTRIYKLGPRHSDGAEMAIIELVEENS